MDEKPQNTKERLLQAASAIFAEKGFHDATVAEICETAEANIAAVNYHFGDKEKLYAEVWAYVHQKVREQTQLPDDHHEIGAEAWLRQFMHDRLKTIFSEGEASLLPKLAYREMIDPAPSHNTLFKTYLLPHRKRAQNAIRDFLGDGFSENQLELATINFMGVHISMNIGHQKCQKLIACGGMVPLDLKTEQLIQQVEDFAIGGLNAIKQG